MAHKPTANNLVKVPDTKALPRPPLINDEPGRDFDALLKSHKISREEYTTIRSILKRAPTMAELGVFSAMWSEHCSYKSSRVHLKRFPTTGPNVVVGPGENAGVVRLSGKLCAAFKMESHNHPSYIEPYQGAATGVGGILRDVFCMGARPVANLNCLRFGEREHPRTEHLVENVVKGIGDYGNCIGVPTVGGNISFDSSYNGNCLVNAMTVGLIHEDKIFKGFATGAGNLVVYVGSATGRDGIHGATMASGSFATDSSQERSTVQVGDPFTEKLLLEATLEVLEKGLVIGLQDMGAAGLTSSSFEMAGRAGNGLYLDLDRIPVRTQAMTAYELLLSESQERMLMVIKPDDWAPLCAVLEKWQLAHAIIGVVTNTGHVEAYYQGKLELDVPVAPLTDAAPVYKRPMAEPVKPAGAGQSSSYDQRVAAAINEMPLAELLEKMLYDTGAKDPIFRQYDHHIGARSVFGPGEQGAAVLWIRSEYTQDVPHLGLLASTACNERYTAINARLGAAHAVMKAARMIAAAGGTPLAVTDCLNFGNPEDPKVMTQFSEGVDGISEACREISVPVVSGNVSLYNQTDGISIAPTPMIGMVGKMSDVRCAVPAVVSEAGQFLLICPKDCRPTFGGSLAVRLLRVEPSAETAEIPALNWDAERESMQAVAQWIGHGWIRAARDIGAGGLATAVAKMITTDKRRGTTRINLDDVSFDACPAIQGSARYFAELAGAYLLLVREDNLKDVLEAAKHLKDNLAVVVGETLDLGGELMIADARISLNFLSNASHSALPL